ncbi:MAG: hypothetical protein AAGU27_27985, partial [Dehalobacterium sp.]
SLHLHGGSEGPSFIFHRAWLHVLRFTSRFSRAFVAHDRFLVLKDNIIEAYLISPFILSFSNLICIK